MRSDSDGFASALQAKSKEPRYAIGIIYDVNSPYFTSRAGLTNVPGDVTQNVVMGMSGVSHGISPEEGSSTVGSFDFTVLDAAGAITDEIRTRLNSGDGIRDREVRVYMGYSDDFNNEDWTRMHTYVVSDVIQGRGAWTIRCKDIISRKPDVFDVKTTTLDSTITAEQLTIPTTDASDFQTVWHTASFSDKPNQAVGYARVTNTKEIFSYTGKSTDTFTGVERGLFGTTAQAVDVNPTLSDDRKPKIEEFIYLEMPQPAMLYSLYTGNIPGTSPQQVLPDHWHQDIDPSFVNLAQFQAIGTDLWDPNDETKGLILRFVNLKRRAGKNWIEEQLHRPVGTVVFINSLGQIELRRVNNIGADAPYIATLDHGNVYGRGNLQYDQAYTRNIFTVEWNLDDDRDPTRSLTFVDTNSRDIHGLTEVMELEFEGFHGQRHSDTTIRDRINQLRERRAAPPLRITAECLPSMNYLEAGDIIRLALPDVRDYAGADTLDRSFEIQEVTIDYLSGRPSFELFGSTTPPLESSPTVATNALPDSFYPQEGTDLDSLAEVTGGAVTADVTLTGTGDMNAAASIWYHLGDLTVNAGVTVTLANNAQLRVRGNLTVNGDIDGVGGGHPGAINTRVVGFFAVGIGGTPGFIGNTKSGDGVKASDNRLNWPGKVTLATRRLFPHLNIEVETVVSPAATNLLGIPDDMRGTSGGVGADIVSSEQQPLTRLKGADGGDSGAGLCIICRGLSFGVSGSIDLSGGPGDNPVQGGWDGVQWFPGGGAGGGPGSLLVLLDGASISLPDLGGKFVGQVGDTPMLGLNAVWQAGFIVWQGAQPYTGVNDPRYNIDEVDLSNAAAKIQYIPQETTAEADPEPTVPAPTGLAAVRSPAGVDLTWTDPPLGTFIGIRIYRAQTTNDRTGAVPIAEVLPGLGSFQDRVLADADYFYWATAFDELGEESDFEPDLVVSTVTALSAQLQPQDIYFESFDNYTSEALFTEIWEIVSQNASASVAFADEPESTAGGRVLEATGWNWCVRRLLVPYDADALYRISCRARVTTRTTDGAEDLFYCGFSGVADDRTTLINVNGTDTHGSQHYICANAFDTGVLAVDEWREFYGYFRGNTIGVANDHRAANGGDHKEPFDPKTAYDGVKYLRPMFIANHNNSPDGVLQLDWVRIEKLPRGLDPILRDPSFDERSDDLFWELLPAGNTTVGIEANESESGNGNAMQLLHTAGSVAGGDFENRHLVSAGAGRQLVIRIRVELVISAGSAPTLGVQATPYEIEEGGRAVLSSDAIGAQSIAMTAGWQTMTFQMSVSGERTQGFRLRIGDSAPDTVAAYTINVDYIEVHQLTLFTGAGSKGVVPDPVTAGQKVLQGDASWTGSPLLESVDPTPSTAYDEADVLNSADIPAGISRVYSSAWTPEGGFHHILTVKHSATRGYQLAFDDTNQTDVWYRNSASDGNSWQSWQRVGMSRYLGDSFSTAQTIDRSQINKIVSLTGATARTYTMGTDANEDWEANDIVYFRQDDAGTLTLAPGGGGTITKPDGTTGNVAFDNANSYGCLINRGGDNWDFVGAGS